MTILIAVQKEEILRRTKEQLSRHSEDARILCFENSPQALAAARQEQIDVAFLDPDLPELNGLYLGQYLQDLNPLVNLIYLAESEKYGYEAMQQHASGYLTTPAAMEGIRREMDDLRYPESEKNKKRVFARTFGAFELFVDGKPVEFKYTKTKEIVAVLVNKRGSQTTNGEIIATLWEDDGDPARKASYLSNLRQDLQNTLMSLNLNGIILKQRGSLAIDAEKIECDLYDWLEKKKKSKYTYMGEYMSQYSWAEFMAAELDEISYSFDGRD